MTNPNPYAANEPLDKQTEKILAVAAHLLAIPFEVVVPIIGYFLLRDRGPFISHHVKESLNFSINMALLAVVLVISVIGWALLWLPPIIWLVMRIIAAIKAAQGEFYRYPLTIRFFS